MIALASVVDEVSRDYSFIRSLNFPAPIGKGGALIEGLKLAPTADLVGYVDADGATSPKAIHELAGGERVDGLGLLAQCRYLYR